MEEKKEGSFKFLLRVLGESITIGIAVMGSILAGAITGWFVEEKLLKGKTSPWITTLFIILGAIGGIKNLIYYSKRRMRDIEGPRDERRN
ncbi:MAG: AtpZ/AtpI family protein [Caldimicrobium sp.]|nr:AtpZ/AtpI family protein [Caldimicrobium sp.]MCX7873386.1 AtpZ/AtpI family protein [Caldimicrobium sp.]MDW8093784.1 AtpZ/AtpI family protein [Caldimicrobium sp.]